MHYLLLHGSWHGAWSFDLLAPLLLAKGHRVTCFDLPGSGNDAHNAIYVTYESLQNYVMKAIGAFVEPVTVVAHSFAGFLAAYACERFHEKMSHIFYVAAWLPEEGKSLVDQAVAFNNSQLPTIFIDAGDSRLRALDKEKAKSFFYPDCDKNLQDWASARLRPKAMQLDYEVMQAFSSIHMLKKSTYILCAKDRVVHPDSQLHMAKRFGFSPNQIKSLEAGHSPFLSKPEELASLFS